MAKSKAKNRRTRKMIRKTVATLFLISAVVVAAIPVDGLRAQTNTTDATAPRSAPSVTVDCTDTIPQIDSSTPIYTTGDQSLQFAYIEDNNNIPVAVIVGYGTLKLQNNTLTIPTAVDAYAQYRNNLGTTTGYCAVGKNGSFLYYRVTTYNHIIVGEDDSVVNADEDPDNDESDDYDDPIYNYYPCFYDDLASWDNIATLTPEALFYDANSPKEYNESGNANYVACTDTSYQIIRNATVAYISNQYVQKSGTQWIYAGDVTADNKDKGIFANNGNISTLVVSESLVGIGDYAFYNCGSLRSIDLYESNGLKVIGAGAFYSCFNMTDININVESNLNEIGEYAFYNCRALKNFTLPLNVISIGDSAFQGCEDLESIDLCSAGSNNALRIIGRDMFVDCTSLKSLTYPALATNPVYLSSFMNCSALDYISTKNSQIDFVPEDGVFSIDEFKATVPDTFYFEGYADQTNPGGNTDSAVHKTALENCFAFRFLNNSYDQLDLYEVTVQEEGTGEEGRATYQTDSSNQLVSCVLGEDVNTLTIPGQIGPVAIYYIGSTTFRDHCFLTSVTIPANIQRIDPYAFAGCHNLSNVIFESGDVQIGEYAFQTQNVTNHQSGCTNASDMTGSDGYPTVQLYFSGPISTDTYTSGPYEYAMSYEGRYNNTAQNASFPLYYSGWPTNLTIQYNYNSMTDTGVSELIDFPALSDISTGSLLQDYNDGKRDYLEDYTATLTSSSLSAMLNAYANNDYSDLTEDQINLLKSMITIDIPDGVDGIKAGLLYDKEQADGSTYAIKRTFNLFGVDTLDAASPVDSTGADLSDLDTVYSSSDFQGCSSLEMLNVYGDTEIPAYALNDCSGLKSVYVTGTTPSIGERAFKDCTSLDTVSLTGSLNTIGDYAFEDDTALTSMTVSDSCETLGTVPWLGCSALSDVSFSGGDNFVTDTSIVYELEDGAKTKIVECLKGRTSKYVRNTETADVKSIAPEAFRDTEVLEVDLSTSSVDAVPSYAFGYTSKLRSVKLPSTCTKISDNAFYESSVDTIEATKYLTLLGQNAFNGMTTTPNSAITFIVPEDSYLYNYGLLYGYNVETAAEINYYTVLFWDWDEELASNVQVDSQYIKEGEDAVPPTPLGRTGYVFSQWNPSYEEITADTWCFAVYETEAEDANKFTVIFQDYDGTELKKAYIEEGGDASTLAPNDPKREGYTFIGWDRVLTDVSSNITTMAQYQEVVDEYVVNYYDSSDNLVYTTTVGAGEDAPNISGPTLSGYTFTGWRPAVTNITKNTDTYAQYSANSGSGSSGSGSGSDSNSSVSGNSTAVTYTLTVVNGSGSGSYVAGSQPIIVANEPASGLQFSNWTVNPDSVKIASKVLSATVITMPEGNVTVTANYAKKTSSSSGSGSTVSGNSSNSNKTNTGKVSSSGTTVVIDKNGLSNTGVVSATVNGSSDNFTIKVSESATASEAVIKALQAEYGDKFDNIKYFPMDISLYDSTGTKEITDTTGLSINITLPLPDSLKDYAGNNKVAGVVNDRLDKLSVKFTTISGVPCVNFTAEHFSPYVIYVDTQNLSAAGENVDNTPKTADFIHPKWFLSLGLLSLSLVLFLKKDKRKPVPVKTK
ncbi:MAG: leucine-rich repeat protein [Acetatifactor sp.]|nr:leucine-rich repeat protein [Acetatifactor sp.]